MSNIQTLNKVVELAEKRRDEALSALGQLQRERQVASEQMQQLQTYANEAQQRWNARCTSTGVDAALLHHHRQFMQKIDHAMEFQRGVLAQRVSQLEQQMAGDAAIWSDMAKQFGLAEADIGKLVSPWHTDADLGRPIEVVTDMSKSRKLGFLDYQASDEAFFDVFARLRASNSVRSTTLLVVLAASLAIFSTSSTCPSPSVITQCRDIRRAGCSPLFCTVMV